MRGAGLMIIMPACCTAAEHGSQLDRYCQQGIVPTGLIHHRMWPNDDVSVQLEKWI